MDSILGESAREIEFPPEIDVQRILARGRDEMLIFQSSDWLSSVLRSIVFVSRTDKNDTTRPPTSSPKVLKDGVSRVKHGKPARADLLAIVVTASVLYALLNYIERSIALTRLPRLTRAPDLPPPREKSRRWVVEGPAEEEKNTMLRPLLGAEVHSAARQQCLPVCTV